MIGAPGRIRSTHSPLRYVSPCSIAWLAMKIRTTLREKLVKIGAKVVTHARIVTFQMAEVAIP